MKSLSLIVSLILTVSHLTSVTAVTDAELEALEKQIEQLESDEKKQAEAAAKRKAEQKQKAEAEAEQKKLEEEKRKAEEAGLAVLEQRQQEEEANKRAEEEKKLLELENERLRVERLKEEQQKERNRVTQAILGEWQSDQGWRAGFTMVFRETDNGEIDGIYYPFLSDGKLIGSLEGNTLSGLWFQSGALQGCPETRNGTTHWGHISFQFINDYTEFIGKWGYCDEELNKNWNGKKIK